MKIEAVFTGKSEPGYLVEGITLYSRRLEHYIPFEITVLPGLKQSASLSPKQVMEKESEQILKAVSDSGFVILLDEKGKEYDSRSFAVFFGSILNRGYRKVSFITGGAFGVSPQVKNRADAMIAFSRLTFSHQLVRLVFMEQLYRAMTILRNEKYHHD